MWVSWMPVARMNISIPRCVPVPLPDEAQLSAIGPLVSAGSFTGS
jgi:hypothetical protein